MIKVKIHFHRVNFPTVKAKLTGFKIRSVRPTTNNGCSIVFTGNIVDSLQAMNRIGSARVAVSVISYEVTPY